MLLLDVFCLPHPRNAKKLAEKTKKLPKSFALSHILPTFARFY